MSKSKKIKKKIKQEFDFDQVADISNHVSDLMDKIGYEDMVVDLTDLDRKFVEKVEKLDSAQMQKLASNINKKTENDSPKNSMKKKGSIFSNPWADYALMTFLFLLLLGTGSIAYLWPEEEGSPELANSELALDGPTSAVLMQPAKFTESGYVDRSSDFIFEVDGQFSGDPEEVIQVEPPIPMDITSEQKDAYTILTATPQLELERDTKYVFSIPANTSFVDGRKLDDKLDWSIVVDPIFSVVATSPEDGDVDVSVNSTIAFQFNHKNISVNDFKENFSIQPDSNGEFEMEGKKIIFIPDKDLRKSTDYVVSVNESFANSIGETLGESTAVNFTTSSESDSQSNQQSEPRWTDYSNREIVQMSGAITTSTDFGSNGKVSYSLFDISDAVELEILVSEYIGDGYFPTLVDIEAIHSEEIEAGGYMTFKPERNGVYQLVAGNGDKSLTRIIIYSDISPIVVEDDGRFEGWVIDLLQSQKPEDISISAYLKGELVDTYVLDNSKHFSTSRADFLIFNSPAGDAVWINGWDVRSISWSNPFQQVDESVELITDQPYYSKDQKIKYYVHFGDALHQNLATSDYSDLSLAVEIGSPTSRESTGEVERTEVLMDPKDLSVSGSLTIPEEVDTSLVRLVLYNSDSEIASKWLDIVEDELATLEGSLETPNDTYLLGESIRLKVDGASEKDFQVLVYAKEMKNSLVNTNYHSRSMFWGADELVEQYKVSTDSSGQAELLFSPYDRAGESAYYTYSFILIDDEGSRDPIDVKSVGVAESLIVMDLDKETEGLITEEDSVSIKFNSINPWSLQPVGNIAFSFYPEIVESTVFERGGLTDPYTGQQVNTSISSGSFTKTPIQLITGNTGSVVHQVENLQVGTYFIHTEVGKTKQQLGVFEVVDKNSGDKVALGIDGQELLLSDRVVDQDQSVDVRLTSNGNNEGYYFVGDENMFQSEEVQLTSGIPNMRELTISSDMDSGNSACMFTVVKSDLSNGLKGGCMGFVVQ